MRLLDPNLLTSDSGKILVRDNVIVFSIEHVRLLITADSVIVPQEGFDHHPLNVRFNGLLEEVIAEYAEVDHPTFWGRGMEKRGGWHDRRIDMCQAAVVHIQS